MQGRAHIYINGTACVSPQHTLGDSFLSTPVNFTENVLKCQLPDFKAYIPAAQLRRLSRMLRVGLTSSVICLRNAGVKSPDGIITATGYGFLEDTERFLCEIIERNEQQLTPTHFMQGTYNALAGMIGLSLQCTGYNNTYVSKGYALGSALDDAIIQIHDDAERQLLVGGYDEAATVQYKSVARDGHFKSENIDSLTLYQHETPGSLQGEGAAFFLLSGTRSAHTLCRLAGVHGLFKPSPDELKEGIVNFLAKHDTEVKDLDLWISGYSGDVNRDALLKNAAADILSTTPYACFKHLTGEYCTADGFALWLGAQIIKHQSVPATTLVAREVSAPRRIRKVLIINHYLGRNYTLYLLQLPRLV